MHKNLRRNARPLYCRGAHDKAHESAVANSAVCNLGHASPREEERAGRSRLEWRMPGKELRTAHLILRPLERAHLEFMLPLIGAREVAATTLRIPHPYTRKDAEDYFAAMEPEVAKGNMVRLSLFIAASDEYCGSMGLHIERDHERAEMGYWIGVPYWGRGYASEAARAVVAYAFDELRLNRVFATVFKGNTASRRVAEKAGMRYEGCLRQHVNKWGQLLDVEVYGALAGDLPQQPR